jgi:hypothetical protein
MNLGKMIRDDEVEFTMKLLDDDIYEGKKTDEDDFEMVFHNDFTEDLVGDIDEKNKQKSRTMRHSSSYEVKSLSYCAFLEFIF